MSKLGESLRKPVTEALKRTRNAAIAGAAVLLLAAAVLLFVDPLNWHILDRLRGEYDAALEAVPQQSTAYLSVNLLSPGRDRLGPLEDSFRAAAADSDAADLVDLPQRLEETFLREMDISLEEDIVPWLGQYIGAAIVSVRMDAFGTFAGFDWVLSIETRNRAASDRFLSKLERSWASSRGETALSETYEGVSLIQFDQITFGRSGGLVLLGSSSAAVHLAIDSQDGKSMADTPGYVEAVARLPRERLVTAYVGGEQLNELLAVIPTALPHIQPENMPTASIEGVGLAFSVHDAGIQIDMATVYDDDRLSVLERTALDTSAQEPETVGMFPPDTLVYLSGKGVDLFWSSLRRSLIAELGRSDFEESMRLFQREFSINPDEALFPFLTGEAAFGVVPSTVGTIAFESGVDLGLVAIVGTGDQTTLESNLATFSGRIGNPIGGFGVIHSSVSEQGVAIYEFDTILIPELLFAYGIGHDYLLLGSSREVLQQIEFSGSNSLAETTGYRKVRETFPEEMSPGLFVDVAGLLSTLAAGERALGQDLSGLAAALQPVPFIASAGRVDGDVAETRFIIFVETK